MYYPSFGVTVYSYLSTAVVRQCQNFHQLASLIFLLSFPQGEPYDTDVRLPMYVRGPGVLAGRVLPHPTNHLDITATFVELAGAAEHAPDNLDGQSFAAELGDSATPASLGDAWYGNVDIMFRPFHSF